MPSARRGYNIGCRLVEEFLARAGNFSCKSFRDTADVVAKVRVVERPHARARTDGERHMQVGFKMFLGVTADVVGWNEGGTVCTLVLVENPLAGAQRRCGCPCGTDRRADFVELPPSCSELAYSNIICGVLRGALEMVRGGAGARAGRCMTAACEQVRFKVQCTFVKDLLRGDDANEIRHVYVHAIAAAIAAATAAATLAVAVECSTLLCRAFITGWSCWSGWRTWLERTTSKSEGARRRQK